MYPAEELKNRSKQFAIRIVKVFRSCRAQKKRELWENKFYAPAPLLQRIIERSAELARRLNSSPR